jgi:hypothetical protein
MYARYLRVYVGLDNAVLMGEIHDTHKGVKVCRGSILTQLCSSMQSFCVGEKTFESFTETDCYILKTTLTLTESVEIFQADFELNATIHYISVKVFQEIIVDTTLG